MIARLRHHAALALADVRDESRLEPGELSILIAAGILAAVIAKIDKILMEGAAS